MRITASILALLILVLSCLPCADVEALTHTQQPAIESQAPADHQHNNQADLCSPFCHCACCVVFTVVSNKVVLPAHISTPAVISYSDFLPSPVRGISLPVWQPPRVV